MRGPMADEPAGGTADQGSAGTADAAAANPSGGSAVEEEFDRERAMHTIRTLREAEKAGAKAARERDDLAARLKAIEDAQKTDAEKTAEELERLRLADTELKAERKRWAAERAVLVAAPKAGITDIALAMAVIDVTEIEFDEKGQPENVDDVLTALVEKHPALAGGETPKPRPPKTDADKGRTHADAPKLTADEQAAAAAMKMSPEDYLRFRDVRTADQYAAIAAGTKE